MSTAVVGIAAIAIGGTVIAWIRGRAAEAEVPAVHGPCRRCGRPVAVMHGELVHTTAAGIFVATEHRPLPVDVYGPHPARGVPLELAMLPTDQRHFAEAMRVLELTDHQREFAERVVAGERVAFFGGHKAGRGAMHRAVAGELERREADR